MFKTNGTVIFFKTFRFPWTTLNLKMSVIADMYRRYTVGPTFHQRPPIKYINSCIDSLWFH